MATEGFGGTAAAGIGYAGLSWAGAGLAQPSCSLLGARCGETWTEEGTPPPAGHLAIGEREPQGLTRRLASPLKAPCDKVHAAALPSAPE